MEQKKKSQGSGATFKAGAVSLAFLIIGYEAAVFVNRAAVLRIEAGRDKPDTVFVYSENPRDSLQYEGGVSFERKDSRHSERVEAVRQATRKIESFRFNPNTVSTEDLQRLGFSEKQAQSIANYREKGGRFRRKEDFAKSYVVPDSVYRRLEPYISIPKTDINKADSAEFDSLPGIGPYFAAKMVSYRQELQGYSYPEQLMDIYHFDKERFDALKDLISCSKPAPYPLWTLPAEELRRHPYIRSWQAARSIVLYRENTPRDSLSAEGIRRAGILPEEQASKLVRCLIAEP